MAISFRAAGTVVTGSNPTVPLPAGIVIYDLLILVVTGTATPTTPAGWTVLTVQNSNNYISVYYKVAGASESSVPLTVTGSTTRAIILSYIGASGIGTVSAFDSSASSRDIVQAPTLTTNNNFEYAVQVYAQSSGATGSFSFYSTTLRANYGRTSTLTGLVICDSSIPAAGQVPAYLAYTSTASILSGISFSLIPSARYWVGGSGTWNTSSTTNWSHVSGGTGGASVPGTTDNVIFDANSSASPYTVTMTGALNCNDLTVSSSITTFATGTTPTLRIAGSLYTDANTIWNSTGLITFFTNSVGTHSGKTINTNGSQFACSMTFYVPGTGVGYNFTNRADWTLQSPLTLNSSSTLTLTGGLIDANNYTITSGLFSFGTNTTLISNGLCVATGVGAVWTSSGIIIGRPSITLSDNSSTARTFSGGNQAYNVFTIGGSTGTSTTTIIGNNSFQEFSSTKTVAHTIAFGVSSQTIKTWNITGTVGNVVTITSTGSLVWPERQTNSIDYITITGAMSSLGYATQSIPWFIGANSTVGTSINTIASTPVAAFTHYWIGGSGTWNNTNTTNWSSSSSGAGGSRPPFADEDVVFDQAGTYSVALSTSSRCKNLSVTAGIVSFTGSVVPIAIAGSMTLLPTTVWSNTGTITFNSILRDNVITTNNVAISGVMTFNGYGSWRLGSDLYTKFTGITLTNGELDTANYKVFATSIDSSNGNPRALTLGSSELYLTSTSPIGFSTSSGLVFSGTNSTINCLSTGSITFNGGGQKFGTVRFVNGSTATNSINQSNTFENLFINPQSHTGFGVSYGQMNYSISANQTITGTLSNQNNTFSDTSSNAYIVTKTGSPTPSSFSPFPGAGSSVFFPGANGNYLSIPAADAASIPTGTNNVTFEGWVYLSPAGVGTNRALMGKSSVSATQYQLLVTSANVLSFGSTANITGTTVLQPNTWYHVAATVGGGTVKIWLNGVQEATGSATIPVRTNLAYFGAMDPSNAGFTYPMYGYLSNWRISNVQRYSTTFTPPTAPFSNDANTVVLLTGETGTTSFANQRTLILSNTISTPRTISAGTLAVSDVNFQDITAAGSATWSGVRLGRLPGNTGITFEEGKNVYWNLAGAQNWSAIGWAGSSGGSPDVINFPLPQDTAVFDNTGSVTGTITVETTWALPTVNMSARTSNMTLATGALFLSVYGNWINGTGTTLTGTGTLSFAGRNNQTIKSNNVAFTQVIRCDSIGGTLTLQDAITSTGVFALFNGTFDCNTYATAFSTYSFGSTGTFIPGTLCTATGTGTVWSANGIFRGKPNVTLSNETTTARTFAGGSYAYGALVIGGATGTSTLTISGGGNHFDSISSTKTVAHTISFGAGFANTIGSWLVTGTSGNIVTVNSTTGGTQATIDIVTRANSADSLEFLSFTDIKARRTPFYAGTTSTLLRTTNVFASAYVAPFTHYWVGGAGSWNQITTTNWSISSGGTGGAAVPFADEDVVFDQLGTYTVTVSPDATCKDLTVTAGTPSITQSGLLIGGSLSLRTGVLFSTAATFISTTTGNTITTNGVNCSGQIIFSGVGGYWTLGSAWTSSPQNGIQLLAGTLDLATYTLSITVQGSGAIPVTQVGNLPSTLKLNSGTVSCGGFFGISSTFSFANANITVDATGSSSISLNGSALTNANYPITVNNLTGTGTINSQTTCNNFTISTAGSGYVRLNGKLTINGTLTTTTTQPYFRITFASSTDGILQTLSVNSASLTNTDFRDITAIGAATPLTGTRIGVAGTLTGITATTPKTVYWNPTSFGVTTWETNSFASSSGGTPETTNYPLPQDTLIFDNNSRGLGITFPGTNGAGTSCTMMPSFDARNKTSYFNCSWSTNNYYAVFAGDLLMNSNFIITSGGNSGVASYFTARNKTITIDSNGAPSISPAAFFIQPNSGFINVPNGTVNITSDAKFINRLTLLNGTLNLNGNTLAGEYFTGTGGTLNLNGGTLALTNSGSGGTTPFSAAASGFSVIGPGNISFVSPGGYNLFTGSNLTYPCTVNAGSKGTLVLSGLNTIDTLSNTVPRASIVFNSASHHTINNISSSGTSGNLVSIVSSTVQTPTGIFKDSGNINNSFLSISGLYAYGKAVRSLQNSIDGLNNFNWFGLSNYAPYMGFFMFF